MQHINFILLSSSLALVATGCTTMSVTKLQTQKADTYEQHTEIGGLVIGVYPMTDKAEVKRMFNVNLLDKGILPILLVAENRNPSSSFIIAKGKVFVLSEETYATSTSQRKEVTSGQLAAGSVIALVGPIFVGLKMVSDATVIEHNIADKEFYSRTLGPGQKAQGFIYFQFPKTAPPAGGYHVIAQIKNPSTEETIPFDLKVNLALAKP